MKQLLIISSILLAFMSVSCKHDTLNLNQFDQVCFQEKVLPIFQTGCAISGCHNGSNNEAGYDFSNYEGIMQAISPGSPDKSKAYKAIITKWGFLNAMPPANPLPESERILIRLWIEQGATNSSCTPTSTTTTGSISNIGGLKDTSVCFSNDVLPILMSSCATSGFHDAVSRQVGVVLNTYSNIKTIAENGMLSDVINGLNAKPQMPPTSPLASCEITQIENWITAGIKND